MHYKKSWSLYHVLTNNTNTFRNNFLANYEIKQVLINLAGKNFKKSMELYIAMDLQKIQNFDM